MSEANEEFKRAKEILDKAFRSRDVGRIRLALEQIEIYDEIYLDLHDHIILFGYDILKEIEKENVETSQFDSQQLKNFIVKEWKREKIRRGIGWLSQEQEDIIVDGAMKILEG